MDTKEIIFVCDTCLVPEAVPCRLVVGSDDQQSPPYICPWDMDEPQWTVDGGPNE